MWVIWVFALFILHAHVCLTQCQNWEDRKIMALPSCCVFSGYSSSERSARPKLERSDEYLTWKFASVGVKLIFIVYPFTKEFKLFWRNCSHPLFYVPLFGYLLYWLQCCPWIYIAGMCDLVSSKVEFGREKKKGKKKAGPKLRQWKKNMMYKRKRQKRFEFLTTISSQLEVSGVLLPICRNMSSLDTACLYIISCLQRGENMKNH